jgi:arylsulfatase A-like enzyme/uncharacterized membrane protein YbhN (UPF0104 family)
MKSKHLRIALIALGALVLAYFGYQALSLRLHPPVAPAITAELPAEQAERLTADHERALTVWNNQFARKGFFALVGAFLLLLGALPKKKIWIPKFLFSFGLVALIIHHLLADGKILSIIEQGFRISVPWILMAFAVKGTGMGCTVWRWKVLLEGQGFKIPLAHLIQSFLIGRFIGSFAPGTSGLDGYRAYDIARYTGKVARSLAVIFVEKLIGFFVLGSLLLIAIPLGLGLFERNNVNATALVMMSLVFLGMMLASLVVLFKPGLIRWIAARFFPAGSPVRKKVDKAVKAVTAYENRKLYLVKALAIGFGVHVCTIGMYFCTSRALYQAVPNADLFVTSALMIGATVLPLSIAGIGMREGVFAFFLGPIAAIYAFTGYLVGEIISLFGGPVWLARRGDYYEVIKTQRDAINRDVEDDDDEEEEADQAPAAAAPTGPLPSIRSYALTGATAGLLAGLGVAIVDAVRLWLIGGSADLTISGYAAVFYGPLLAVLGAAFGGLLAGLGKLVQRPAAPPIRTATFVGLTLLFVFVVTIGFFFLERDVFGEKAGLFAPKMLGSLVGLIAGTIVLCTAIGWLLRRIFSGPRERLCKPWIAAAIYAVITGGLLVAWAAGGAAEPAAELGPAPEDRAALPNIVLVMNDTHRPDHTGAHGGPEDLTKNLDALAADGVVYDKAFAQASWTRPSVATILTGRYPSSHTATLKGSVLPGEINTLPEVLLAGGYETIGIATNYNLTPFFNFDQGFVDYRYLQPDQPLWSNDAQAKLIGIEVLKKIKARFRGDQERPEDYYVTGDVVTAQALSRIDDRDTGRPFFTFLSYMDVHDPYFRHPFDGYGISHRANPEPDPSLAAEMKSLYAGEVRYWDQQLGALLDGLKQRGLYDDTLIVVVSDHGEEFGEHGGFWHGTTLYEEQLRVVFVVKYPASAGIAGGARVDAWMRLLDVAPLIIDAAGLEIPDEMQGVPAPASARTPVFAEEDHQGNLLTSILFADEDGAEVKLIRANEGNPRGLEPLELYRLDEDPGETENLAAEDQPRLDKAKIALDASEVAAKKGAAAAQIGELTPEQKRVLEQLGYMKKGE